MGYVPPPPLTHDLPPSSRWKARRIHKHRNPPMNYRLPVKRPASQWGTPLMYFKGLVHMYEEIRQ